MADRDPITAPKANPPNSIPRSDKLNGENRTKSVSGGNASYSSVSPKDNSAPPPNNPYNR